MSDKLPQENCASAESHGCGEAKNRVTRPRSAKVGAKRRRVYIQQSESSCSGNEESFDNTHIETSAMNGMTSNTSGLMYRDKKVHHGSTGLRLDTDALDNKDKCVNCRHGENLLSCTGRGCKRSFHIGCLNPPLSYIPPGAWYCIWCVRQKIESGVHVVAPGVEAILDDQDVPADDEGRVGQKQYLVKYKGLAHVHSRWISERELILQASVLLHKYKYKYKKRNQKVDWKTDWSIPHRLLQKRLLLFPDNISKDPNSPRYEWLVKWRGLSYEHATWELEDASFLKAPEAKKLIEYYEQRHKRATSELYTSEVDEAEKADNLQFSNLVFKGFKGSDEISNEHTVYVNYLHQAWLRGRNSVIIDEQERITRVVLFILSLQKDVNQPSLIITTSQFLSMYEAEFSRWLPSANIVVYRGNRDVRVMIRTLEFYNESGCIMFQVLLSAMDAIIEDQDSIESLNFAVIVVDESQRLYVTARLNHIKTLHANMRFLIIADHIKDTRSNYNNILSFLDPEDGKYQEDWVDAKANNDTLKLKEKMNQFLAYRCPFTAKRFLEYWVPVQLSDVQREQYCASLLSKSSLLCSSIRADSFESLHDIMVSSRKCCDHPYLVNSSLRNSVIQGIKDAQQLDAEIEISGKLRLLDKILVKIKERGLRVLIVFQTIGTSGSVSIGDIIDDFIHQRYGDSYTRIDEDIPYFNKREAANLFNKDGEKFICLIEARACVPTIELQSVDTIILFDSNWEPLNDLKFLQKITISSQFDQVKVFRLYSTCTLEEGLLLFAKEGVSIGCSLKNIKQSTCQRLLSWGASYQFQLLNSPDGSRSIASNVSCEQALIEQVLSELVMLLPTNCGKINSSSRKVISEVHLSEGGFSCDISLPGERENRLDNFSKWQLCENDPPHIFWKNLLAEKRPRLGMVRRKVKCLNAFGQESVPDSQDWNDSMEETNGTANLSSMKYKLLVEKKLIHEGRKRKFTVLEKLSHGNNYRRKNRKIREKGKALSLKNNMTIRKQVKPDSIGRRVPTLFGSSATQDLESPACDNVSPMQEVPGQFISSTQPNINYSTYVDENSCISRRLDDTNIMFDTENNPHEELSPSASEMPKPEIPVRESVVHAAGTDPWQIELDKIQRELELATKIHEEKRLQLQCDCKKELNEIQRKYALSLENVETTFMHKREDLLTSFNRVSINKSLAGVMTQMRSSAHAAGIEGTQKVTISDFMEEIFQLFIAPTSITNTQLMEESSLEPDEAVARMATAGERSPANPHTNSVPAPSSVDAVDDSLAITLQHRSRDHQGQLSIPNIRGEGNRQTGSIVRSTAPHLRNTTNLPGPSYA